MRPRIIRNSIRQVFLWFGIGRRTLNNLRILRFPSYHGVSRRYRLNLIGKRTYGGVLNSMTTRSWSPKKNG